MLFRASKEKYLNFLINFFFLFFSFFRIFFTLVPYHEQTLIIGFGSPFPPSYINTQICHNQFLYIFDIAFWRGA